MKIAWIGTGVMGKSMAANLQKCGHTLTLFNRTVEKAKQIAAELGMHVASSIAEAVRDVDAVFTIVGYPDDVKEVMVGDGGIFEYAPSGCLIVDMTTSLPSLAVTLHEEAKARGLRLLDAPVSGGDAGAKNATLSIMVGGDEADFESALSLLKCMGTNIVYMGPAGNGQHTKAANQIAVAGATAAMTEALVYCKKVGLDPEAMLRAISAGAAGSWQLSNMAPRVLQGDYEPGFFVKHFIKDMKIVKKEMEERHVDLKMLAEVLDMYEEFAESGHADLGTQALINLYEEDNLRS